jgi:hypothetical protein
MTGRLLSALRAPVSRSTTDRRAFLAFAVIGITANIVWARHDLSHQWWLAQLRFRERVVPLTWPRQAFTPEGWASTPDNRRHVFAKDLTAKLPGRTKDEVVHALGGRRPPGESGLWKLSPAGGTNLWHVLHVEFTGDTARSATITLAWLDP